MPILLKIFDQTNAREKKPAVTLHLASERITGRELLERRIKQEVEHFNSSEPELFQGLVQPTGTEKVLNGYRLRKPRLLDWREQAAAAASAFDAGRLYLLVDDRQLDSLDEELVVAPTTEVIFLKLVLLVGG